MPDIFDEVEEDLRAERAKQLARRWGGLALGLAVAVVAATGAWQGWRWHQAREGAVAAETYLNLHRTTEREGADLAAAAGGFAALGREAPSGYATLARLRAAALHAEAGDRPAAIALWDEVAADGDADGLYRDLATLLSVTHSIDTGDPASLDARIGPLTALGNPWRASAREVQALIAIRRGAQEEARRMLEVLISDPTVPEGMRERAGRVAAGLRG